MKRNEKTERSKADFMALCANESSSENPNNSTTKNDLEVECISRADVFQVLWNYEHTHPSYDLIIKAIRDLPSVTPISKECIDCIAEDKTFLKMDRVKQLLNSDELDDWEVLKKIREVAEE